MADPAINQRRAPDLDSAFATLRGLLTSGETLEAWAVQHRLYALTNRRVCIDTTSTRFISLNRRLQNGYKSAHNPKKKHKYTQASPLLTLGKAISPPRCKM